MLTERMHYTFPKNYDGVVAMQQMPFSAIDKMDLSAIDNHILKIFFKFFVYLCVVITRMMMILLTIPWHTAKNHHLVRQQHWKYPSQSHRVDDE